MSDTALPTKATDELRHEFLGCLLFVAGSAIFYMMPAYLALVGGRLSLDAGQLGSLAAIESLAIGINSLFGPLWVTRFDRRLCLLAGVVICAAGDIATALGGSFTVVLIARFMVGLLGEGVLYTLSCTILGGVRKTDRAFAIALTASVAYGALILATAAPLEKLLPAIGPLAPLVLVALAVLPFTTWLPSLAQAASVSEAASDRKVPRRDWTPWLALAAQAIWFGAPGAFWTFAEQVAIDKGVPSDAAELALSVGELAGLLGSILAAVIGDRWGRFWPIAGASIGMALSSIVYQHSAGVVVLGLVLSIFYGFWNYGTVYQMSFVARLDTSGRASVIIPAAQVFGLSVGPFAAGRLMLTSGDAGVTLSTVAFAAAGLALYLVCFGHMRRRIQATGEDMEST